MVALDLIPFHAWDDGWSQHGRWQIEVAVLRRRGLVRAIGLTLNRGEPENGIRTLRTELIDAHR